MKHYCQACNSIACDGNCAKATDKAAIEAQHRRDCAAFDDDANSRADGHAYCDRIWELVVPEIHAAISLPGPYESIAHSVLKAVRMVGVSAYVAGRKEACGAKCEELSK